MVETDGILIGIAIAFIILFQLALVAYAAWERRNSDYQYERGVNETLQDPNVVHAKHVDTHHALNVRQEEHTNSKNSLASDRTSLTGDD